MDEARLLELISRLTRLAEEYGAIAATSGDKHKMQSLIDQFSMYMEEIRRTIRPPQQAQAWGVSSGRQMGKTATSMRLQAIHEMMKTLGLDAPKEEPEDDTEIEFSL